MFEALKDSILLKTDILRNLFEETFMSKRLIEKDLQLKKLEKEYDENISLYLSKMKMAQKVSSSQRQKRLKEVVRISMHLYTLSVSIRKLKYGKFEVSEINGMNFLSL